VFCEIRILNSFLQYLCFLNPYPKQFCAMLVVYEVLILLKSCDSCVLSNPDTKEFCTVLVFCGILILNNFVRYLCFVES
jgi:hypothetical protein